MTSSSDAYPWWAFFVCSEHDEEQRVTYVHMANAVMVVAVDLVDG
jgi:hypothetical protein